MPQMAGHPSTSVVQELHARIRSLAPALPALVRATHHRLRTATELVAKAADAVDGETFVVVVSKTDLKLDDLGSREDDPQFFLNDRLFEPRPFDKKHRDAVDLRARGIILTDDYAPVENLLAPVAETRGDDD